MATAELLRSPSTGLTRRTFQGKRWLVVEQQDEASPCRIGTFRTEARAQAYSDRLYRAFRPMVHYVERAEVVGLSA